jgi:hypothetical protein
LLLHFRAGILSGLEGGVAKRINSLIDAHSDAGRGNVIIKAAFAPAVLRREFTRLNAVTRNKATVGPQIAGPRWEDAAS